MRAPTLLAAALLLACAPAPESSVRPDPSKPPVTAMTDLSETYVKLILAMGVHEPSYVDAYYGPAEWQTEVETRKPALPEVRADAEKLLARVQALPPAGNELGALRQRFLAKQLAALIARADMVAGKRFTFDEESQALYDAVAPVVPEARFDEVLANLDKLVPGPGPLPARLEAFRKSVIIPPARLQAVFEAAIAECKARTLAHVKLPASESFTIEYVKDKPWGGYNWYKGNFHSVIQVNTDLPIFIDRAIDLACHEGYPGHHVFNLLLEERLVRQRGWTEFTIAPLFGPMSLIAEGSANYGIDVAFPGEERIEFERRVLYPLAGLDPSRAATYAQITHLLEGLRHATNQVARRYLDGQIDATAAAEYLTRYALQEPARAKKSVSFIEANRSYVINYNLGKDLVAAYVEGQPGAKASSDKRWAAFLPVISSPMVASDLQ